LGDKMIFKKESAMRKILFAILILFIFSSISFGAKPKLSRESEDCISCHTSIHPGIVADWQKSLHSKVTPALALKKDELSRKISVKKVPDELANIVVGCAECHIINSFKHKDSFEHAGYKVHTVITPDDCAVCHQEEADQYSKNMMSYAYMNLNNNLIYHNLIDSINGVYSFEDMKIAHNPPDDNSNADSCYFCHGTKVEVIGMETRETSEGEMEFPILSGWPNQGVGRVNPDGTIGSCTSCHTRHQFSIEMARKPYTCAECHKGPDVPAYKVYMVSKHGNIYSSFGSKWNYKDVPWIVGKDFSAPTCATCHISLVATEERDIVIKRSHQMNDRISWRIFGLIYAHPHPKSPNTTIIVNKNGLPLPTELTGGFAKEYLIDEREQEKRRNEMKKLCLSCHSYQWVEKHYERFENTIKTTNQMTLTATKILVDAWQKGAAKGLEQNDSIFNEAIEKKWVEQWLFYANSTRFSSAMAGADYGAFAFGRWYMSKGIQEMFEMLQLKLNEKKQNEIIMKRGGKR